MARGSVCTRKDSVGARCRKLRSAGRVQDGYYVSVSIVISKAVKKEKMGLMHVELGRHMH